MDRNDMTVLARDAAYTAVGFCVLGFQQLQVRRRELTSDLTSGISDRMPGGGGGGIGTAVKPGVQKIVRQAERAADPVLDGVEKMLPGTARIAMQQSRTAARVLRRVIL